MTTVLHSTSGGGRKIAPTSCPCGCASELSLDLPGNLPKKETQQIRKTPNLGLTSDSRSFKWWTNIWKIDVTSLLQHGKPVSFSTEASMIINIHEVSINHLYICHLPAILVDCFQPGPVSVFCPAGEHVKRQSSYCPPVNGSKWKLGCKCLMSS